MTNEQRGFESGLEADMDCRLIYSPAVTVCFALSIPDLFQTYRALTEDAGAAATLVLAHVQHVQAEEVRIVGPEKSMTVAEAAGRLNISPRAVYDMVSKGVIGCHRVGGGRGKIRFLPSDLDTYRNAPKVEPDAMDPGFAKFVGQPLGIHHDKRRHHQAA